MINQTKEVYNFFLLDDVKCNGGMQDNNNTNRKYVKEIKTLVQLFGDSISEEELQQKIEHHHGDIELLIKDLVQQSIEKEVLKTNKKKKVYSIDVGYFFLLYLSIPKKKKKNKLEAESKINELKNAEQVKAKGILFIYFLKIFIWYLFKQEQGNIANETNGGNKSVQKEMEKTEIGETKPGINLQGYCSNDTCLASKAKLPVWVNIGFDNITFISDKTSFSCPDCKKSAVNLIVKAIFYNSEHSISASDDSVPMKENNYQCSYSIKSGLSYELKANKIRQHATSIGDLIERSERAMGSIEIKNLVTELQKYEITVVKPPNLKGNERLLEKIQADYGGDFNQAFDIGRFTILCDNPTKLQTAVAVMKKAEQFNLIVSEDKDFFDKQSKTHHRFHNIKLYVPKHD
ncbi:hypothetical protein RFI_02491, partial [Reticulomyxa filosa]